MSVKKIALLALYTAMALIIHIVESLMPLPVPLPGVKLGLANTITLFMLFMPYASSTDRKKRASDPQAKVSLDNTGRSQSPIGAIGNGEVIAVLICRILLGAIVAGRPIAIAYSLAGGLLAVAAQIWARRIVAANQIWVCGAIGGAAHNIGQVLMAAVVTGTPTVAVYMPALVCAGIITGALTGMVAQLAVKRLSKK